MKTIVSSTTPTVDNTSSQPAAVESSNFQAPPASSNVNKRPISLDLNAGTPAKKQRLLTPTPLMLETPDLQNLKTLNTPDLEKILLSSNLLQTPQPGLVFPSKAGQVTSEQEAFGKGFEEALHSLHHSKISVPAGSIATIAPVAVSSAPSTIGTTNSTTNPAVTSAAVTGMSGGSFTYTNLESNFPVAIKEEPLNPSNSPPPCPIDMEAQEKIKLDRKRLRNRVAASKCRKRKLERISKLEDKVKMLKGENTDLGQVMKNLKNHVAQLKQQVIDHIETGCSIPAIGSVLSQGQ